MAWSCRAYEAFLFSRSPHYDLDVLKDWFPTDSAWIGHVATGKWDAFTGTTHTYDKMHVGFPNLSGCWTTLDASQCMGEPCNPVEKKIGWGSTRKTYSKARASYSTNPLCFDQINTKEMAKEQFANIISGLKDISNIVQSDRLRREALRGAETIQIAGSAMNTVTVVANTFGADCTTVRLGSNALYPTSKLTMPYLMNFQEPLQFEGYFKSKFVPNGTFKLITDMITARDLREGNPALTNMFRFTDFQKGGELFKYGITSAVGNFGISLDYFPMRFYPTNDGFGGLQRVFAYTNVAATIGLKPRVSTAYINAPIQLSYIWHPEAMRVLHGELRPVSSEMPFLVRDLMGKWTFAVPDVIVQTDPDTGTTCTIDNKRHNQGVWYSDFENGIRYDYPNWMKAILHLREPQCVVDQPNCSTAAAYAVQDYNSGNPT
jgi:hypothetical protein